MTAAERTVHFYVGTYASETEDSLFHCVLNAENGEMRLVSGLSGIENPSYLKTQAGRGTLYAASEKEDGEIFAYTIDPEAKELHLHDRKSSEGSSPCFVETTPDGNTLLAANYGGCVTAFSIRDRGVLRLESRVRHTGSGPNPQRQEGPHPHSFVPSPDGVFLFAPDLGTDRIAKYTREDELLFRQDDTVLPPGTGPRTLVFHPGGRWAYVSGELDNTVTAFHYEAQIGRLTPIQRAELLPEDRAADPANTAAHAAVSPCGRYVYVSNRGDDSIAQFAVDPEDGRLTFVERVPSEGRVPRHFAMTEGFLLAANQESGSIVSFSVNPEDGRLTPTGFALELNRPVCVCPLTE
ncbi:lactonase family protein [Saccharibacillus alkalitolerans]|uniref:Lactonase family protein n=1 Tax=Saccharibacillus alkalitolerans TaxID=2705290 RepID=A0ABX0FEA4_9BACL|nr:lactonase family protein [Saccharibacillus alkalitolerans]NGZ77367.1 lactonase family protein [Saccharibacillus alkalitolerans]